MNTKELFKLLNCQLDPDRVLEHAQAIYNNDRWNSFRGYRRTADYLADHFREYGAEAVERIAIPCDGKYRFGDWRMPFAWDAAEGILELTDGVGNRKELLADYRAIPNNLIRWSRGTVAQGEILDMLYLPDGTDEKAWQTADAKGKLVFTQAGPDFVVYGLAVKYGAVGLVTDVSNAPDEYRREVQWWNCWGSLPLWGITGADKRLLGFSLTPEKGARLKQLFGKTAGPLRVRATVHARYYAGTTDIVTALIKGKENPRQEIIFYAHVYECQIDDNAVSAGLLLEIVRVIQRLIRAGTLPPPRRSIRFVLGWEWIGSEYYALKCKKNRQWLASLCYDAMAARQQSTRSPLVIHTSPGFSASFADGLFVDLWKEYAAPRLPLLAWKTARWVGGTDTQWIDPMFGNVSNVYPAQHVGATWHKSHSTLEMIDPAVVKYSGLTAMLWALQIAGASADDAAEFAAQGATRVEDEIRRHTAAFDFTRSDAGAARRQFEFELGVLQRKAERVINTAALGIEPVPRPLQRDIQRLQARMRRTVAEERRRGAAQFERYAPRRTYDWMTSQVAGNTIPQRLIAGAFWSLAKMNWEQRCKLKQLGYTCFSPLLYLCDGKRSIADIILEYQMEFGPIPNLPNLFRAFKIFSEAGYLKLEYRKIVARRDLVSDLRRLGIRPGETLLVHSSLSSLGPLEAGVETIFGALEEAVGCKGTVVFPSFAYNTTRDYPAAPYDPQTTLTRVGTLADLFFQRKGVLRSRHPSHGLAARGRQAAWLLEDNIHYSPYDIQGAFGKLYQLNAKILMLGCGLGSNSTLHAIEDWLALPSMIPDTYHYLQAGKRYEVRYEKEPYHHRDFYSGTQSCYARLFRERRILREGMVGLAGAVVMRVRAVMNCGVTEARHGRFDILYCNKPDCATCQNTRKAIRTTWRFPADLTKQMKALSKGDQAGQVSI